MSAPRNSRNVDTVERIAADLDQLAFDYDWYEYNDQCKDREEGMREAIHEVSSDPEGIIQALREIIRNETDDDRPLDAEAIEYIDRANTLIARIRVMQYVGKLPTGMPAEPAPSKSKASQSKKAKTSAKAAKSRSRASQSKKTSRSCSNAKKAKAPAKKSAKKSSKGAKR